MHKKQYGRVKTNGENLASAFTCAICGLHIRPRFIKRRKSCPARQSQPRLQTTLAARHEQNEWWARLKPCF